MLYTGKGDGGTTTAFGCNQQRISKSSELPEALGALDELNAFIGFVKMCAADSPRIGGTLREAQETLFIIQAEVAGADKKVRKSVVSKIEKLVNDIEKEIPNREKKKETPKRGGGVFLVWGGPSPAPPGAGGPPPGGRAERRVIA